jgi:hypothetical protein
VSRRTAIQTHCEGAAGRNEDRVVVEVRDGGVLVAVIDGAGGMAGGDVAADLLADALADATPHDLGIWLAEQDARLARHREAGRAAIAVVWLGDVVMGASVGDCELHWRGEALTHRQRRKPLVGSGEAVPIPFASPHTTGRLLATTDGVLPYLPVATRVAALDAPFRRVVPTLLAGLRPGGRLVDDVGIVVVDRA